MTKTYCDRDLEAAKQTILSALKLWTQRCAVYMEMNGDRGSCVLGAGIAVNYIPRRCRTPRNHIIIPVPHTAGQGSLTWECAVEEVLRFLDERGIEAFYEPGHMD